MKTILVTLFLEMLWFTGPTNASPKKPNVPVTHPGCTGNIWLAESNIKVPPFIGKDELIKLLRDGGPLEGEQLLGVGTKPWGNQKGTYVAVMEVELFKKNSVGGRDAIGNLLWVGIIRPKAGGKGADLIARLKKPITLKDRVHFNRFDLAAYRFNEKEIGFGVRWCHVPLVAGGNPPEYEYLQLFRMAEDKLVPTFYSLMHYDFGTDEGKCLASASASLDVAKTKTKDAFDLVKWVEGAKPATYQWDGQTYKTSDPEPLESKCPGGLEDYYPPSS